MRIVIAMDSFKGNLSSLEVAALVEKGIREVYPKAEIRTLAVADGGEGTAETLTQAKKGRSISLTVRDPLGRPVKAGYGLLPDGTAVMEMASASGLCLLQKQEQNPLIASTYGTGQMLLDAMNRGCRRVILGIGGSATNDGGAGMAQALGIRLLDGQGLELPPGGGALRFLDSIDTSGAAPALRETEILVACDVDNPLCGPLGATHMFGKQKGATPEMTEVLERGLLKWAQVIQRELGVSIAQAPGAGAAGGLGAGLMALCNAKLCPGIELVLDTLDADTAFSQADVILTGEGKIDGQTAHGKVPAGVARRAKRFHKPVFAIGGFVTADAADLYACGIDAAVSSMTEPMSLKEALEKSPLLIEQAAQRLFRIIHCFVKEDAI